MKLDGKIALITGAAHRLGKSIAMALADQGCDLMIHFNQAQEAAAETAEQAQSLGVRAVIVGADLSQTEGVHEVYRAIDSAYGRIDLLANSAAILERRDILEVDEEDWRKTIGLNLKGAFFVLQEAARRMQSAGGGAVVNISDSAGHRPWKEFPLHSISKAGLEMLTQAAAFALAPDIRVNAVIPGPTLKPPWMPDERWNKVTGRIPLGQAVPTHNVAQAVVFLMTNEYITGHSLRVDGGDLLT
ncbi:MAG: 3-oxoacyl-ACP reductase FabG [Anaerolineae bacterium]|nr:MAG: 3-oxoacyl-ACP reductase FabG [Anaerolineae bacterium]